MVWSDPANNFDPPKPVPTNVPTGCYKDSTYTCKDGTEITDDALKGVAYIFKGTASASNTADETIQWKRFFEHYNSVTALALSRSETNRVHPTWDTINLQWTSEPEPTTIYQDFVAGFLQSPCLADKPHKIVILDYQTGALMLVIPYESKQTVFK